MARIGLLGGCFNPVHNAHLRLALEVQEQLGLDSIECIPSAVPPHKPGQGMLDFDRRVEFLEAATASLPQVSVNTLEADRPGPSYTIDTLCRLRETRPDDSFWFILGACDLLMVPLWKRGLEIVNYANLAVANRVDDTLDGVIRFMGRTWPEAQRDGASTWRFLDGHQLDFVEIPRLDISSSQVRERWISQRSVYGLVPECIDSLLEQYEHEVATVWKA
ncbi:nicotinate (nicotinamide) nucleotide adenylyltransferase [Desulfobaculum bizertense]|uniref:nicotinate (nicotinamide) nucleotide adenylyltransferase n=1 Tax=Desulfobaculum bizertense TaxID=376490 RepID=UPI001EEE5126|nr:nicotinate (nicotinamide) nucleotide adenylyltransferase [Desulfobaculum bizertense]UIJ38090.1 nicotinate (nicotinamide) nucleotide adenylyltransferase [Desulfobaculum bizertense]